MIKCKSSMKKNITWGRLKEKALTGKILELREFHVKGTAWTQKTSMEVGSKGLKETENSLGF